MAVVFKTYEFSWSQDGQDQGMRVTEEKEREILAQFKDGYRIIIPTPLPERIEKIVLPLLQAHGAKIEKRHQSIVLINEKNKALNGELPNWSDYMQEKAGKKKANML